MNKNFLKYGLHAVILIGLVVAGVRYLNGEEVLRALKSFDYSLAPFMLILTLAFVALNGWRFVILMRQISDIPWGVIFRGYLAGTAATLLPGGMAARAGLMNQAGVSVARSSAPVLLMSILDQTVFIGGSLIAALWVEEARLAAGIILFPAALASPKRGWSDFWPHPSSLTPMSRPRP